MKRIIRIFVGCVVVLALLLVMAERSFAEDIVIQPPKPVVTSPDARPRQVNLVIKDHRFDPPEIVLMPNEKIILHIINKDDSAEEFESRALKREKIIPANSEIDMAIGPLRTSMYEFIGEFHEDTARGRIRVMSLD